MVSIFMPCQETYIFYGPHDDVNSTNSEWQLYIFRGDIACCTSLSTNIPIMNDWLLKTQATHMHQGSDPNLLSEEDSVYIYVDPRETIS